MRDTANQQGIQFGALGASVVAFVLFFFLPSSIFGYIIHIAAFLIAIVIGHRATRRAGRFLWVAILALVLSYLGLIVSVGLLAVRLTRTFMG